MDFDRIGVQVAPEVQLDRPGQAPRAPLQARQHSPKGLQAHLDAKQALAPQPSYAHIV